MAIGGFVPDYGYKDHIEYQENINLWNKISGYMSKNNIDMRMNNIIKNRKGEEEILQLIASSPHKDILLNNPNILKWFIAEKILMPKIKGQDDIRKTKYYKRDTKDALSNIINRNSGIREILKQMNIRNINFKRQGKRSKVLK